MNTIRILSDRDKIDLGHALRIAGQVFAADAASLRAEMNRQPPEASPGIERLAAQFDKQKDQAMEMADLIESAESIEVRT